MILAVHNAATRFDLTQTHKSIGVSVLVLTPLRLGMRCFFRAPKLEPIARSVAIVGRAVHVGLYVLLLLLPFSGWPRVTSTPLRVPTIEFGLFELRIRLLQISSVFGHMRRTLRWRSRSLRLSCSMEQRRSFMPGSGATAPSSACGCEPAELLTHFVASKPVNLDTSEASDRVA